MDTKKLRQKILDLAIRGKLVPQDPNDEPASALLQRIKSTQMVKLKWINTDKEISENQSNQCHLCAPFEIPKSWEWVKLKDIFDINPKNDLDDEFSVSFIPMTLISEGFTNKHTSEIRKWKEVKKGFTHFREGDVGIAKITPCFENRKSIVFRNLENGYGAGTTELHILRPIYESFLSNYIIWFVKTEDFITNGISCFNGAVGQQRVGKNIIEETYFPLPPLPEQHRIVSVIESAFALIDEIEANKLSLSQFIKQAKSKVLDLAIRGKLVPQDPNDEPASALLQRMKSTQAKRINADKEISDNQSNQCHLCAPFEIPESWEWVTMNQISEHISAGGDKPEVFSQVKTKECPIPIYSNGIKDNGLYGYTDKATVIAASITISARGTIGYSCVRHEPFCPIVRLITVTPNSKIITLEYLHRALCYLIPQGEGSSIPQLTVPTLKPKKIPLPPLPEQHRIVQKIETIFQTLDKMQTNL